MSASLKDQMNRFKAEAEKYKAENKELKRQLAEWPTVELSPQNPGAMPGSDGAIRLVLPLGEMRAGAYCQRHLQVQLNTSQSRALRRLFDGLADAKVRLEGGRPVASAADAVRWLLERLADAGLDK